MVVLPFTLILLPVAYCSGWYVARSNKAERTKNMGRNIEEKYLEGVSYLVSQNQDKALDVFIELLSNNIDAIEIHFILAELFRQKGEIDRSIRIHQNIIARENIPSEKKVQALSELASDYYQLGIFDRAERIFLKIDKQYRLEEKSLFLLLKIYERQKLWHRCLDVAKKIQKNCRKNINQLISQYYCELATASGGDNLPRIDDHKYLQRAMVVNVNSLRASIMLAENFFHRSNYYKALISYKQVLAINPSFSLLYLQHIFLSCEHINPRREWTDFLNSILDQDENLTMPLYFLLLKMKLACPEDFLDRIRKLLSLSDQSWYAKFLLCYEKLIGLSSLSVSCRDELISLADLFLDVNQLYVCCHCGFTLNELQWQCPSCDHWSSIEPCFDLVNQKALEKV